MRDANQTRLPLLWLLSVIIVASQSTFAQTVVGRISGTVQDANGAAVANATVRVINSANNSERTAMTDDNGFYTVTNLPAGHDAYVVGNEPVVVVDFFGATQYAKS